VRTRLQDWLTLQAGRRPEAVAVVSRDEPTTYETLEKASNRFARALKGAGCVRGDRVGLLLSKSTEALIAMFGTLKADCIYVPLDVSNPRARIERILQQSECRCVVGEQSSAGLISELARAGAWPASTSLLWVDDGADVPGVFENLLSRDEIASFSCAHVCSCSNAGDAAHILFTSGSTGTPKGVVITHSNVVSFVRWAVKYFAIGPGDRLSGHPPLHFDLSTFDIHGTIAAGAQIHLLPSEINLLPHRLAAFIRDAELTQWFSVPSALRHMAKFDVVGWNDFPALRRLLWCGETFSTPDLRYWMQHLPHVTFDNLYGPTEATIASSYYRVQHCPDDDREEIPIGQACDGESLLVLNEQLRPVALGEIGGLYITGVGLSPGYWRDSAKTDQVFLQNPYSPNPSSRIYNTGDLAKIGDDRLTYLVGRSDTQIKSRGYRIELGEIEAALATVAGIQEAAIVAIEESSIAGKAICCAYVPLPGAGVSPVTLKQRLTQELPQYMIPIRWMLLERLPQNGNGKIDRKLLKEWFEQKASAGRQTASEPAQDVAAATVQ
jgi:amino acid adenylation domain-containing protein